MLCQVVGRVLTGGCYNNLDGCYIVARVFQGDLLKDCYVIQVGY